MKTRPVKKGGVAKTQKHCSQAKKATTIHFDSKEKESTTSRYGESIGEVMQVITTTLKAVHLINIMTFTNRRKMGELHVEHC